MNSYESFTPHDAAYFSPLLPIIRAESRRGLFSHHFRVTAIYPDQVVLGRCTYLETIHAGPLDAKSLNLRLHWTSVIPLAADSRVIFSPGNRRKGRATFRVHGPRRATFEIPNHEIEHPLSYLRAQLGERLTLNSRVALNSNGILLLGLIMAALMVLALVVGGEWIYTAIPTGMLAGALLSVFVYDQWAAPPPWLKVEKKKKIGKDLSGRQPFRSPRLGLVLKIVFGAILLLCFFGQMLLGDLAILVWPIGIVSMLGLYYGHLLSQRKPDYVRAGDTRPPILYLRSFLDDRKQTLVANTRWAVAAGVLPPRLLPSPWNYVMRFSPVRVLRVLLNRCVDTSEEQIGLFLRQLGPFVAIGQPGDTFAAPGAARMYVTNDEWKGVVDSYLAESQYIVLQPAGTEGVWWEVERVLTNVPLQKILFCMVNFHLRQNDYEAFLLRTKPLLKESIPLAGGLTTTPAFLFFDQAATPRVVATSYSNPVLWPWLGNAVDLGTTLKPFLTPAAAERLPAAPERPRGMSAGSHFLANCVYIGAIVLAPMMISFLIMLFPAIQAARLVAQGPQEQLAAPAPNGATGAENIVKGDGETTAPSIPGMIQQADVLFEKKDWPALDKLTARMIALDPNHAQARAYRGLYLQRTEKPDEALQEMRKATELDPKESTNWGLLGQLQVGRKEYADAEQTFSTALEINPEQANYYYNRGFARFEQQKYELAAADYARAIELKSSNQAEACVKCGLALQRSGKVVESIRYFNTAEKLDPQNVDYKLLRAKAFEALGNHQFEDGSASEYARAGFDEVLKLAPDYAPARFSRGLALQRLGKHAEAIADFDVLVEKEPKNDLILWRRGYSNLKAGHYDAAFADLQKSAELDPKDTSAPELLIRIRVAQGRFDEALPLCDQQLQKTPDQLDFLARKAIVLFLAGREDEAGALCDRIAPKLLAGPNLGSSILGMLLVLQSDRNPELLQQAIAKADAQAAAHPQATMLAQLAVGLRIRAADYAAADKAARAIESTKLTGMALAFHQLCQAKLAAQLPEKEKDAVATAAARTWFDQHCPQQFDEGQPETLNDDWTSRVLLGKFYRDLLPSLPR